MKVKHVRCLPKSKPGRQNRPLFCPRLHEIETVSVFVEFGAGNGLFCDICSIYDGGVWPETETVPQTEETINCQQLEEHEVTEHQRTSAINH